MDNHKNTCRVAAVQNCASNNILENCDKIEKLIIHAAEKGKAEFIHLPENAFLIRKSDKEDAQIQPEDKHIGIILCKNLAKKYNIHILIGSIFAPSEIFCGETGNNKWYNRSILINGDGEITSRYDKIHLFDATFAPNIYYQESARVVSGGRIITASSPWGKIGLSICYDVRFAYLYRDLAKMGAKIIAIPAAFSAHTGKTHWHILVRARAIETGAFIVAAGQCGTHNGNRDSFGHSLIINPWGEILAEAGTKECVISATLNMSDVDKIRGLLPCLQHDKEYIPQPDYII